MTSPGWVAEPFSMFSVAGIAATRSIARPSSAIAATASRTAAAPDMSIFISCIPAAGLIEIPPESKVTPLPTRPSRSPPPPCARLDGHPAGVEGPPFADEAEPLATATAFVAQRDEARRRVGAGGYGHQPAHASLRDLLPVEDVYRDRIVGGRELARSLCKRLGLQLVRREALELARAVGRLRDHPRDLRLARDVVVRGAGERDPLELRRGLVRVG